MNDVTAWREQLQTKKISASEIVDYYLTRIDMYDPMLNSYLSVQRDAAKSAALLADKKIAREEKIGVFEGIPLAVKDLFDTAGVVTSGATRLLQDRVPEKNARVWSLLADQGAILLGKLNMHEFAYGTTSENPHYGAVHNPWDVARIAGGSSGGSGAAVAADLTPASLGTDTGGSIRIPSAMTGIYGLKPTYGLVSVNGVMPLAFSLDHVGPMTRSVRDAALMLEVMAGYEVSDPHSVESVKVPYTEAVGKSIHGFKVGYEEAFFMTEIDQEVMQRAREVIAVLEDAGATKKRIQEPALMEAPSVQNVIISSEAYALHESWLADPEAPYGEDVRTRLLGGKRYTGVDYANALLARRKLTRALSEWFGELDVFVAPVIAFPATALGDLEIQLEGKNYLIRPHLNRFTSPFNLSGLPAMSIPCGLSKAGLPLAVQIVAGPFQEEKLLRAAAVLEKAYPWMAPPLFS